MWWVRIPCGSASVKQEADRAKQEGLDRGMRDRHREMETQMMLRLSMMWGEEAVRIEEKR